MILFKQLESLVSAFQRDVAAARALESPNPEDDLIIRTAIVGFSYSAPVTDWDRRYMEFVRKRVAIEFENENLSDYGQHGNNVPLFYSLALGFLLGRHHIGIVSDDEFAAREALISGVIMLHLKRITAAEAGV